MTLPVASRGNRLRVLVLHNRYRERGGEDSVVRAEVESLRAAGHEVTLYEVENPSGPATLPTLATAPWNVRSARRVTQLVAAVEPDVVHVHNTWFRLSPAVVDAVTRSGTPCVATLHNYRSSCVRADLFRDGARCTDCLGHSPLPGVLHRCYRGSVGQSAVAAVTLSARRRVPGATADLYVVPSRTAHELLVAGGLPADRVRIKPNPVPDPGPRAAPPSASDLLVYAGRADPNKGLPDLLAAWAARRPPGLRLEVVGAGGGTPELAGVTSRPWLSSDEVRALLLSARAVVCPSRLIETFGLSAVEGMAAGLPVATTSGGALAEVVGDAGPPPVPPGDVAAWAASLAALGDDAAVDAWGCTARARYDRLFAPASALAALEQVYAEAMARRSTAPVAARR